MTTARARTRRQGYRRPLRLWLRPRHIAEAAGIGVVIGLCRALGLERASAAGARTASAIGPRLKAGRRMTANLSRIFQLPPEKIAALSAAMWDNLGRTFAEYAHLDTFSRPAHHARLEIAVGDKARALIETRQGRMFFFSGHFANWELMPLAMTRLGIPGAEIYRPADNPYVDRWLLRLRRRAIAPIQIPKGRAGAREMVAQIRASRSFAALIDEYDRQGIPARLFGLPAMTSTAAAIFALRYGYALVPAHIERRGGARFHIRIHDPLPVARSGDYEADCLRIAQAVNDFLEGQIRANPEQWMLWLRKWPALAARRGEAGG